MLMFDRPQLTALAAVHRRGSFELAAADLGVTQSAVSQRIRALEEQVGTLLIRRGVPSVATAAGLRLVRHHDEIMLLEGQVAAELPGLSAGPATLRIALNADSLATWIMPALAEVEGVLFDLVIDDQDFSQDWLRRGEVAAAVTSHAGPLQGCDTKPLGRLRYLATASPAYMARWFDQGVDAARVATAPMLRFNDKDALQEAWLAAQGLLPAKGRRLRVHKIASSQGFVDACLHGLGWGMNPENLVAPHLASGALVPLLPDRPLDVALHWQFARLTAPALAPLTRAMQAHAAKHLL